MTNYLDRLDNKESFRDIYDQIYNKKPPEVVKRREIYRPADFLRNCLLSYAAHFEDDKEIKGEIYNSE